MAHLSPITCVDQRAGLLVTGGYDGRVIGWDGRTALWEAQFDDLVNDVRVSSDGRVAVAVADRYAYVLDGATGARALALGPHGDDVNAVRWLPNDRGLICVMDHLDPVVRVWRPDATGEWVASVLAGHESGVFGAAVSPDGLRLATAAEDRTARIWDIATATVLHVLAHPGDPEAIDWSPDGSVVATGCDDEVCRLWDPATGALIGTLTDAKAAVRFVRFDESGARLLVGAYDSTMRTYDTSTWSLTAEHRSPLQWERTACFAGPTVVIGSFGAEPVFHPPVDGAVPLTFGINALHVDSLGMLVGRDDGAVLDVLRGEVLSRHSSIVNTVSRQPSTGAIASADYRGTVHITTPDGEVVEAHADGGGPVNSVVWSRDGETLLAAGYDGVIRRWSASGILQQQWTAHGSPIKSLVWSDAADAVIAGSSDGTLSAWRDGELLWRAQADDMVLVNAVAVGKGGSVVVSASRDLRLRMWDADNGDLLLALPRAHTKSVKAIAVSDDLTTMVSGSYDGTALLWTLEGSQWSWRPLHLHGKPGVPAVALHDGNVLTAGWDGSIGRWTSDGRLVVQYRADRFS